MTGRRLATFVIVGALALPVVAAGQQPDLAAAAEKEKERRKKSSGGAKTYGNQNLPASSEASPAPGGQPSPSPNPVASESRQEPRNEAYWRGRATGLRNAIAVAETRVRKAQDDYDAARKGNIQPLPIDALSQVPPNPLVNSEADRLQKDLEDAKAALTQAQKALADFEEEARKAGVLPGWLR